jgi:hypothetical protein
MLTACAPTRLIAVVCIPWLIAAPNWMFGAAILGRRHEATELAFRAYRGWDLR